MENKSEIREVNGLEVTVIVTADPYAALVTEVGEDDLFIHHIEEKYDADKADFFASTLDDPDFPDKAERWRASQRTMLRFARTLVRRPDVTEAEAEKAFEWLDRVMQDAVLLEANMKNYYKRMKKDNVKAVNKAHRAWTDAQDHLFRIDATGEAMEKDMENNMHHALNGDVYSPGGPYESLPEDITCKSVEMANAKSDAVPAGHSYYPAFPYPPERIRMEAPVPLLPMPYVDFRLIDPEELAYDLEHDEFYIPEGYVSKDGSLDHNSIKWDWEKEEVTCQYVGGVPVTWKFYKTKKPTDMISGWAHEYYRRYWSQTKAGLQWDPNCAKFLDAAELPYNIKPNKK